MRPRRAPLSRGTFVRTRCTYLQVPGAGLRPIEAPLFGCVIQAGAISCTVLWETLVTNRIAAGDRSVIELTSADGIELARVKMARALGVEP